MITEHSYVVPIALSIYNSLTEYITQLAWYKFSPLMIPDGSDI